MKALKKRFFFQINEKIKIATITNFTRKSFNPNKPLYFFNYGIVSNNDLWKEQLDFLYQQKIQFLAHDYRGHHQSSNKDIKGVTFADIIHDINFIIDSLNAKKVIMVGHSMGVSITLNYTLKYLRKIHGLILISGTLLPPKKIVLDSKITEFVNPILQFACDYFPEKLNKLWKHSHLNPIIVSLAHKFGFNPKVIQEERVKKYLKNVGRISPAIFLSLLNEMEKQKILKRVHKIECPTLIIGGEKDIIIPNYLQNVLHRHIKHSELYIVKNAGHAPQSEYPDNVNTRIATFIRKNKL